jgi:hypothetical protein
VPDIETNTAIIKACDVERTLDELAGIIRDEIQNTRTALSNALDSAMNAGDALIEAQQKVKSARLRGGWKAWLKFNCPTARSTAQLYMQLARHRAVIEAAIQRNEIDSSLRAARRLISSPKGKTENGVDDDGDGAHQAPPQDEKTEAGNTENGNGNVVILRDWKTGEEHAEAACVGPTGSTPIPPQDENGDDHGRVDDAEAAIKDPLVIEKGNDEMTEAEATPWFASKMRSIFDGSIKNYSEKSASALSQFRQACAALLPQMTIEDLQTARSFIYAVADVELDAEKAIRDAKRIKWEAKHPDEAKKKARDKIQADAMEDDIGGAKAEARENGEAWSDLKDEWVEDWLANNWDEQAEADFENEFQERWQKDHGKPWAALNAPKIDLGSPIPKSSITEMSPTPSAAGDLIIPNDLCIPAFLRRTEPTE